MKDHSLLKVSIYVSGSVSIIVLFYGYGTGSFGIPIGVMAGNFLSFLNIMAGYLLLKKFFYAHNKLFLKVFFGSMLVRMLATLMVFITLIGHTKINKISFTLSLVISYILYSVIEMIMINKNLKTGT